MCGNALLVTDNYILSSLGICLNVTQWVQMFSEGAFLCMFSLNTLIKILNISTKNEFRIFLNEKQDYKMDKSSVRNQIEPL